MTYLRFVELEKSPNKIQNQLLSMRHFLVQFDSLFSRGSNASGVYLRAIPSTVIPRNSAQFCTILPNGFSMGNLTFYSCLALFDY